MISYIYKLCYIGILLNHAKLIYRFWILEFLNTGRRDFAEVFFFREDIMYAQKDNSA